MGLSIKLTEAERLLLKLGWERAGDAKDIIWLYRASDRRPVLRTKISKGRGDMKGHVADKFRAQLKRFLLMTLIKGFEKPRVGGCWLDWAQVQSKFFGEALTWLRRDQ